MNLIEGLKRSKFVIAALTIVAIVGGVVKFWENIEFLYEKLVKPPDGSNLAFEVHGFRIKGTSTKKSVGEIVTERITTTPEFHAEFFIKNSGNHPAIVKQAAFIDKSNNDVFRCYFGEDLAGVTIAPSGTNTYKCSSHIPDITIQDIQKESERLQQYLKEETDRICGTKLRYVDAVEGLLEQQKSLRDC